MECKKSPLILFLKDIEKSVIGNQEAYTAFKAKLEALPENVVVIASHTQTDIRKDRVCCRSFLYSFQTKIHTYAFIYIIVVTPCNSHVGYSLILVDCFSQNYRTKQLSWTLHLGYELTGLVYSALFTWNLLLMCIDTFAFPLC